MKIDPRDFVVEPDEELDLAKRPTRVKPVYRSKDDYQEMLAGHVEALGELQELLYASNEYALLVILQAMDAAGKDGAIKHVMSGINPQGCHVTTFKHPSATELDHDFLWRTTRELPARGEIGIFNRSYYEEVLIVRVHPEILKGQNLPAEFLGKKIWKRRYRSICDLEAHLHRNGTRVVKFFLHISPEEQRRRLLARIEDPNKHWKFNAGDLEERKYWNEYMQAYEECLQATSTTESPWYVVPADDKENARLIVSRTLIEALQDLKLQWPRLDPERERELEEIRKRLAG